ncbi:hypothetical protein GQX73_g4448 [Xylaria multiplex]|uniref:Uncharacterized protein n=1 Tax=Xylaria multiplex TaxID=323545 RepID=A0A7C8N622_9PEZI|nr:hypothetical protein GQX73_g4448 [Xylaria multiplex]
MESIPPVLPEGQTGQEMLANREGEPGTLNIAHKRSSPPSRSFHAGRRTGDPHAIKRRRTINKRTAKDKRAVENKKVAKDEPCADKQRHGNQDYPPLQNRRNSFVDHDAQIQVRVPKWLRELPKEPLTPTGYPVAGPSVAQLAEWLVTTMADVWLQQAPESTVHEYTQDDAINPDIHGLGQRDPLNLVAYLVGAMDIEEFHCRILRCDTSVVDKIPTLSGRPDSCPHMVQWLGMMASDLFKMFRQYRQTLDVIVEWDVLEREFRKLSPVQQIAAVARAYMRLPEALRCRNCPPKFPGQPSWGSLNRYLEVAVVRFNDYGALKIVCFPLMFSNHNDMGDELRKLADSCTGVDNVSIPGRVDIEVLGDQSIPVGPEDNQTSQGTRHWSYRPIDATDLQATGPLHIDTWYPTNMQEIYELVTLWGVLGILLIPTSQMGQLRATCRLQEVIDLPAKRTQAFPKRPGGHVDILDDGDESYIVKVLRRGFASRPRREAEILHAPSSTASNEVRSQTS